MMLQFDRRGRFRPIVCACAQEAEGKADQLAQAAGVKLGKPTYISESSYMPGPIYRQDMVVKAAGAPAVPTPISPGEMEITMNVQLAYAILD